MSAPTPTPDAAAGILSLPPVALVAPPAGFEWHRNAGSCGPSGHGTVHAVASLVDDHRNAERLALCRLWSLPLTYEGGVWAWPAAVPLVPVDTVCRICRRLARPVVVREPRGTGAVVATIGPSR